VENQLSPSLISLSPLVTTLPSIFPHTRVRSSNCFYTIFNLFMTSSLGFGSIQYNFLLFSTRFCYASLTVKLALLYNSLTHYAKGTLSLSFFITITQAPIAFTYQISTSSRAFPHPLFHPFLHSTFFYRFFMFI